MYLDQRVEDIITEIENFGWKQSNSDFQLDWWADFIIKFESTWSPTNTSFYLIALIDPQYSKINNREVGCEIWAISVNDRIPQNRMDYLKCWDLKEAKKKIEEVKDIIDQIRNGDL